MTEVEKTKIFGIGLSRTGTLSLATALDILADLKRRGVQGVDLWVSDGNQATMNAITNHLAHVEEPQTWNQALIAFIT